MGEALFAIFMFVIIVLILFIVTGLLLALRVVLIVMCILLSPIAFAMLILPNTKKMFDRWWKLFSGMLMLYPTVGFMFGLGEWVKNNNTIFGSNSSSFIAILTMAAPALAMIAVPFLFLAAMKAAASLVGAGGAFSAAGKMVGGKNGLINRARKNGMRHAGQTQTGQAIKAFKQRSQDREDTRTQKNKDKAGRKLERMGAKDMGSKMQREAGAALKKKMSEEIDVKMTPVEIKEMLMNKGKWHDQSGREHQASGYEIRAALGSETAKNDFSAGDLKDVAGEYNGTEYRKDLAELQGSAKNAIFKGGDAASFANGKVDIDQALQNAALSKTASQLSELGEDHIKTYAGANGQTKEEYLSSKLKGLSQKQLDTVADRSKDQKTQTLVSAARDSEQADRDAAQEKEQAARDFAQANQSVQSFNSSNARSFASTAQTAASEYNGDADVDRHMSAMESANNAAIDTSASQEQRKAAEQQLSKLNDSFNVFHEAQAKLNNANAALSTAAQAENKANSQIQQADRQVRQAANSLKTAIPDTAEFAQASNEHAAALNSYTSAINSHTEAVKQRQNAEVVVRNAQTNADDTRKNLG